MAKVQLEGFKEQFEKNCITENKTERHGGGPMIHVPNYQPPKFVPKKWQEKVWETKTFRAVVTQEEGKDYKKGHVKHRGLHIYILFEGEEMIFSIEHVHGPEKWKNERLGEFVDDFKKEISFFGKLKKKLIS